MQHYATSESREYETMNAPIGNTLLNAIALGGPGPVAIVRQPDLQLVFVNDQFTRYLGYKNEELGSICFTDMLHTHQHDRLNVQLASVKESIAARSAYSLYEVKNKAGTVMPYFLYATPMAANADDGEELCYLLMQPDMSKWGMPFTSFETKELFLEQFDGEDFGTFEWFVAADKVYWSHGLYRIYDVDESEDISHAFAASFIHPADKVWVKEEMESAFNRGKDLDIEFRIVTSKKAVKILHSLARTIIGANGDVLKFAGSVRDITEQRSIENDLKNKVEELNHSNRELEEFAYIASHDMQEPLRKITTFSDRLHEKYKDVLTGDGAMYLSRMIVSAENMRNLINDLLEFSRITKTAVPFSPIDLNELVKEVNTDLELIIEETGTVISGNALPVIDAISSQVKQLFINIINNAIKFHKPGVSPLITIASSILSDDEIANYKLEAGSLYHMITIKDNGIGFEQEYASRIFQVFQRLHGKSEYPGSGIGLAICKKIVEYHHGTIFADSVPEEGACFTIILPESQKKPKALKP